MASAHCLKFYTRVRGYATHSVYDYTNFETNAEGTAVRARQLVYFPKTQKSSLHFPIPKVQAAFVPCGVFRRPKILFRLLNINQAFQHAVQSTVHGNLVNFLGNFFQCFQFFQPQSGRVFLHHARGVQQRACGGGFLAAADVVGLGGFFGFHYAR